MFTRIVSMQLKPNTQREFTEKFEKEIIPTLKRQQGFQDEMLFVVPDGPEVVAISLWDSKESAETYNRAIYPEVLPRPCSSCAAPSCSHKLRPFLVHE